MSYVENIDTLDTKKLGISEDLLKLCKDKNILALFNETIEKLKKRGFTIKNVPLKHTHLAVQTYYPLVYTEFYSATRKFDGRKYGLKIEESCGEEVLRRILGGKIITQAEFKGAYYKKSLLVKSIIQEEFMQAFKEVDAILCPTVPKLPHNIGEKISVEDMYAYDALTIPANLAGICGGSVNAGYVDKIP
jgi:aspartyl-tRNA(Asn)/glutamyl-tRNA(Gln) amidotransferase subunit A